MAEFNGTEFNNFTKRLQSALKRRGISISLSQIKESISNLIAKHNNQLTEEVQHICLDALIRKYQPTALVEPESVLSPEANNCDEESRLELVHQEPDEETQGQLATQEDSQPLTTLEAQRIVIQAIEAAPVQIRQQLIAEYAHQQFSSASQLVSIKQAIDAKIEAFLAEEFSKSNGQNTQHWNNILTDYKEQSLKEAENQQQFFQGLLSDLDTRISEFKL